MCVQERFWNFKSGKGFYCRLKGELVGEWGGLSYAHRVRGQAHVFVFIAA